MLIVAYTAYTACFLAVWALVSVAFTWKTLGDKCRKGRWYDYPLLLPVLAAVSLSAKIPIRNRKRISSEAAEDLIKKWKP